MDEKAVKELIEQTATTTVVKLKKAGLIRDDATSLFKKTERLLYEYKTYSHSLEVAVDFDEKKKTQILVGMIDAALKVIENDEYYELIPMIYFERRTREQCAEEFNVEVTTVTRNKNKLVHKIKNFIFSDKAIEELFM